MSAVITSLGSSKLFGASLYLASAFLTMSLRRYKSTQRLLSSHQIAKAIANIESAVQRDEGGRGIGPLCIPGQLASAAERIMSSRRVVIITGFPCLLDYNPPTETDGPLGALAIARACLAVGKRVIIATDQCNEEVMLGSAAAADLNRGRIIPEDEDNGAFLTLDSFPGGSEFAREDEERLFDLSSDPEFDLVIAIERAGPSRDGSYRTMRKRDMTSIVAPLDQLLTGEFKCLDMIEDDARIAFRQLYKSRVKSIGIGDGGNEVGMGKVFDKIVNSSIPNAPDIACVTAADDLITASVSNWGGYALAAAVALTATSDKYPLFQSIHHAVESCLPNRLQETAICQRMVDCGGRDGLTAKNELMVDGMPLEKSLQILEEIAGIAVDSSKS